MKPNYLWRRLLALSLLTVLVVTSGLPVVAEDPGSLSEDEALDELEEINEGAFDFSGELLDRVEEVRRRNEAERARREALKEKREEAREKLEEHREKLEGLDEKLSLFEVRVGSYGSNEEPSEFSATLTATGANLFVKRELAFEDNDESTVTEDYDVTWDFTIGQKFDALLVGFEPEQDAEARSITLALGDFEKTYSSVADFGREDLGADFYVELKAVGKLVRKGVPSEAKERFEEHRANLSAKIANLEGESNLPAACDALYKRLRNYNSIDEDFFNAFMTDVEAGEVECSDLLDRFEAEIIPALRVAKHRLGLLDFKDVDDDQWFAGFVGKVKEREIVEGYRDGEGNLTGDFGPGDNVTIGAVLKMAALSAGIAEEDGETENVSGRTHWSRGFLRAAETRGLTLVRNRSLDLNRPATRGELLRTVLEFYGAVDPDAEGQEVDDCGYSDVADTHPHYYAVCLATNQGIVSGDSDADTFRPNDPVTRAEVSKILVNASAAYDEGGPHAINEGGGFRQGGEVNINEGGGFREGGGEININEGGGFREGGEVNINEGGGF